MPAPPLRTDISNTYPNPSNDTARSGFGKLWDYVTGLLGATGNAPEARAALGALAHTGGTLTSYRETVVSANSTASYAMNCSTANIFNLTLTANCTLSFTNIPSGVSFGVTLALKQDATGSRTVTWPANTRWSGGTAPSLTTTAGKTDFVSMVTLDAGSNWYAFVGGKNF